MGVGQPVSVGPCSAVVPASVDHREAKCVDTRLEPGVEQGIRRRSGLPGHAPNEGQGGVSNSRAEMSCVRSEIAQTKIGEEHAN